MNEIFYIEDDVEVAPAPFLRPLRNDGFGSIEDLPDEELASPAELERIYYKQLWGPVLLLPKPKSASFNPAWDCNCRDVA